jgi:hypothetical protein
MREVDVLIVAVDSTDEREVVLESESAEGVRRDSRIGGVKIGLLHLKVSVVRDFEMLTPPSSS